MIYLYGFGPAWGLPDLSPFVTKVANYLVMADLPHQLVRQSLDTLKQDSPNGKLPYLDDGQIRVADSARIIQDLRRRYGDRLDARLTPVQLAIGHAYLRMIEESTYWSGIIYPRWRTEATFEVYLPHLAGTDDITPERREQLLQLRERIADQLDKQGTGLRSQQDVEQCFAEDIEAVSVQLGDKPFFLDSAPSSIDASLYATLRHVTDAPWDWFGRDFVLSKTNLVDYTARMRERFHL